MTSPENYQEGVFSVAEELADLWTGFCFEQGVAGCEILQEVDGEQRLKCYLTEPQKLDEWISRFRDLLKRMSTIASKGRHHIDVSV